jgi:penicillin-binding protein 1A
MQVARNFYLSTEKTLTRKLYEVLLALKIESQLSKDQILEIYMNQIYLGQRAHGFAAASEIYFGKPLQDMTVAEAAMLAGLPKAPSAYNPIANPSAPPSGSATSSTACWKTASSPPSSATRPWRRSWCTGPQRHPVHGEYVAELARQMIFAEYGPDTYTRGLQVQLTVRSDEQNVAYRALRKGLMDYEQRQHYRGPESYVDLPADPQDLDARVAEALADHPDNDELKAAVVLAASPRKVVAALQSGDTVTITGDGLKPVQSGLSDKADPKIQIRRGAIVRVLQDSKGNWTSPSSPRSRAPSCRWTRTPAPSTPWWAASTSTRTSSTTSPRLGASRAPASSPSSIRPHWRRASPGHGGQRCAAVLRCRHHRQPALGAQELRRHLRWPDDAAPGPGQVKEHGVDPRAAGHRRALCPRLDHPLRLREGEARPYLTMALGAGSVTPMQMVIAYSVFANGGYRVDPVLIAKVSDARGHVLHETPLRPRREPAGHRAPQRLHDRQPAAGSGPLRHGRQGPGHPEATGPVRQDRHDQRFDGRLVRRLPAQPGRRRLDRLRHPRKLGSRETGGGLALPVWIQYMSTAIKNTPVSEYEPPAGVVNVNGEWYYDEYANGHGVSALTGEEHLPHPPTEDEKKGILDLFR